MHYVIFAIVPNTISGEEQTVAAIKPMMAPFDSDGNDPLYNTLEEDGHMYNPNGHWDWYRPGGRWDGMLINNPQSDKHGFNWGDTHATIANNRISISDYLEGNAHIPFGIVYYHEGISVWKDRYSVDGSWSRKPDGEWETERDAIFEQFRDGYDIVSLDCHD